MRRGAVERNSPTERVVLLVLRDDDNRDMYTEFLRYQGFSILGTADADAALRLAPHADVIVTGIHLGDDRDGAELITHLRRDDQTKNMPIIVLAASVFPEDRARVATAGCDTFLPMPCLPEELLGELRRLLLKRPRHPVKPKNASPALPRHRNRCA